MELFPGVSYFENEGVTYLANFSLLISVTKYLTFDLITLSLAALALTMVHRREISVSCPHLWAFDLNSFMVYKRKLMNCIFFLHVLVEFAATQPRSPSPFILLYDAFLKRGSIEDISDFLSLSSYI
jgi:hypothetical protein